MNRIFLSSKLLSWLLYSGVAPTSWYVLVVVSDWLGVFPSYLNAVDWDEIGLSRLFPSTPVTPALWTISVKCWYFSKRLTWSPSASECYNIFMFAAVLGMGGQVLVGGLPGMPAMVQQMPHITPHHLGLIGVPRFRWQQPADQLGDLQAHLARQGGAGGGGGGLTGPAANLLAHPLLGVNGGAPASTPAHSAAGVIFLPRLP